MALYTLYPCKPDGVSETFVTFELADDGEALLRARGLLQEHATADYVAIWCGERKVATHAREDARPPVRGAAARQRSL